MEAFRKANDDAERQLEAELLRKFNDMGLRSMRQSVVSALSGDQLTAVQAALDALDWAQFVEDWQGVSQILQDAGLRGGRPVLNRLLREARARAEGDSQMPTDAMVDMSFNTIDRNVVNWAQQRAGVLIVEISADMRNTAREVIVQAVNGGYTADEAARMLAKVMPLHSRYATAVMRRERNLLTQYLANGMTADKARAKAAEMGTKYAAKLVRARARTIARTEIMTASNFGQYDGYKTAISSGLMSDPGSGYRVLTKEWITAEDERVCPVCGPLDKVQVDWNETFGKFPFPPAHPNCRCSWNVIDNADQYDFDGGGSAEDEFAYLIQRPASVATTLEMTV